MLTSVKTRLGAIPAAKSFLSTMEIFKKLPPAALAEIEKRMVEKKYSKLESILLEGDPAECVWFVKEGHVKAVNHSASNGRCQTLCMVGAKGMFGTCCCLGGGEYPCHAVAESEVTVVSLPMADFMALLERYPGLSIAVAEHLSKRLRQTKEMQTFEQESVEKRILHVLLNLLDDFGRTIPLTRREIAEMVGTTVETSIRTFARLEQEGVVSTARGKIIVRNAEELAGRLESENGAA